MNETTIPAGLCACGCGQETGLARQNHAPKGLIKGQPHKFVHGHNNRGVVRERASQWKGGKHKDNRGYVLIMQSDHPRANNVGYVFEHVLIAEKALEKPLPPGAEVHHFNENTGDNRNKNLVICQDHAYHMLLHSRQRAFKACGNPNYRPCRICKQYDDPANLYYGDNATYGYHKSCNSDYQRLRYLTAKTNIAA